VPCITVNYFLTRNHTTERKNPTTFRTLPTWKEIYIFKVHFKKLEKIKGNILSGRPEKTTVLEL